mmetsp:Transcript_8001/g.17480  ORF Transcript_8001/g.17480 Transcript_8001/m.17480 type:complete len:833 (-) Transcript_8001:571-3069(-)
MWRIKITDANDDALNGSPSRPAGGEIKPRAKVAKAAILDKFTIFLTFTDEEDNKLYIGSLMELFYFPAFWPIMLVILVFAFISRSQSGLYSKFSDGWVILVLTVLWLWLFVALLVFFTIAQMIEYWCDRCPPSMLRFSEFILRNFLWGRIADGIVLSFSTSQGLQLLLVTVGNFCIDCGNFFKLHICDDDDLGVSESDRFFPFHLVFFSYTVLLIMPIFLKSTDRHVSFAATLQLSLFMVAALVVGRYRYTNQSVFTALVFLLTQYEFERNRMTSFLLGKEALTVEKLQQEKTKADAHAQLERRMNQALLQQILPPQVAKQLLSGNKVAPEEFESVTIFFSDVVGFTNICAAVSPIQVVKMLNELYTVMDYCTSHFPLYKVETIGDAYMLVGGLPVRDAKHAEQIADFALLVSKAVQAVKSPADGTPIRIRIGIHSGSVMAGVVGNLMPRYCLFGDTVNTASRMESNGEAGKIHLSSAVADILHATGKYVMTERGAIPIKGKGIMTTHWLDCAEESNVNSNELAIAKLEVMVMEILQSAEAENAEHDEPDVEDYESGDDERHDHVDLHMRDSSPLKINRTGSNVEPLEGDSDSGSKSDRGTDSPGGSGRRRSSSSPKNTNSFNNSRSSMYKASPAPHSNPNALHSIRYNITNRLSEGGGDDVLSSAGAKILVVEDSPAQRKMLVKRLHVADPSWDVSQAVSGEDALAKLQAARWRFDVVFVDENLSIDDGLFGHELVHLMRRQSQMSTSVIIACTSNPAKVSEQLLAAGVDYVWPKPPPLPGVIKPKIDALLTQRVKAFALEESNRQRLSQLSSQANISTIEEHGREHGSHG